MSKVLVKPDGNCLFNCASLAVEGSQDDPMGLRKRVAAHMLSKPQVFNAEELGKDPAKYTEWLTSSPEAWGGIPELKALSEIYGVEFGVVVIQDLEILLFGHGQGKTERVYVLFDGTHYNLAVHEWMQGSKIAKFNPKDEMAYQGCLELAKDAKEKMNFVDPAVFSLICMQCNRGLVG